MASTLRIAVVSGPKLYSALNPFVKWARIPSLGDFFAHLIDAAPFF
jgi:hypothetical protein